MSSDFFKVRRGLNVTPVTSLPSSSTDGSILFDDNVKQFKRWSSSANAWIPLGEGSAGVNYLQLSNKPWDAESGTAGFNTYKDAAAARPVDGTGGTVSVISAVSTTTTTPISGSRSFLLAKGSGNAQGEGWSIDFQVDIAARARVLNIEFDYMLESGTFVAGNFNDPTTAGDSDLIVYIYDIDAGQLIEPTTFKLASNSTSIADKFRGSFQTSATSTNYRLIFHVARTSTAAWTLEIDNIRITPTQYTYGTPITDWVDFPSVAAGTLITATTTSPTYGTVDYNRAQWRRVGSNMEIRWVFRQTTGGTAGAGDYLFNLPPGYQIDVNKLGSSIVSSGTSSIGDRKLAGVGYIQLVHETGAIGIGHLAVYSPTQLRALGFHNGVSAIIWSSSNYQFSTAGIQKAIFASVPIAGWSSSVKISEPLENRDVVFQINRTTSDFTIPGGTNDILKVPTDYVIATDTVNGWRASGSPPYYEIQISGWYLIEGNAIIRAATSATSVRFGYSINTTDTATATRAKYAEQFTTSNATHTFTDVAYLRSGDRVYVGFSTSGSSISISTFDHRTMAFKIVRLPSAQIQAQSEAVVAKAHHNSGGLVSNFAAIQVVNWNTPIIDTHNAFNASAGTFTAPVSGFYEVVYQLSLVLSATTGRVILFVTKNLTSVADNNVNSNLNSHSISNASNPQGNVVALFYLNAGDVLRFFVYNETGGSRSIATGLISYNFVHIKKIG